MATEPSDMTDDRQNDHGIRSRRGQLELNWRANFYRDAWLFLLSVLLLVTTVVSYNENRDRVDDIQRSRIELCERQNMRHDRAIIAVNRLINRPASPRRHVTPAQRLQAAQQVRAVVDAMVPRQNCRVVLEPPNVTSN